MGVPRESDFDWLLEQEIPHMRRYAVALTGDSSEADDLVQDCLERALRKHRLWRRHGSLRRWLFRMLYRLYLNRRRGNWRHRLHISIDRLLAEPAQPAMHAKHIECLDTIEAMAQLPDEQRAGILLVALENLSYDEAAWVLGIPVGTLRSRISRGRETLRNLCDAVPGNEPVQTKATLRRVK